MADDFGYVNRKLDQYRRAGLGGRDGKRVARQMQQEAKIEEGAAESFHRSMEATRGVISDAMRTLETQVSAVEQQVNLRMRMIEANMKGQVLSQLERQGIGGSPGGHEGPAALPPAPRALPQAPAQMYAYQDPQKLGQEAINIAARHPGGPAEAFWAAEREKLLTRYPPEVAESLLGEASMIVERAR